MTDKTASGAPDSDFWAETLALASSLDTVSYYAVLAIAPDAAPDAIEAAFYQRARTLHPDRHAREKAPERRKALSLLYSRIGEAYRVLKDPVRRKAYDEALEGGQMRLSDAGPSRQETVRPKAAAPKSEAARRFFDLGVDQLRAGDERGARMQFQLALQLEPDSPAIKEALAKLGSGDAAAAASSPPGRAAPVSPRKSGETPVQAALQAAAEAAAEASTSTQAPVFAREHTRERFIKPIKVQCPTWEQFVTLHARNLSASGIFLKTSTPLAIGTLATLRIALPDGRVLELDADVVRVVAPERAGPGVVPGMGLRFCETNQEVRAQIADCLARARSEDAEKGGAKVQVEGAEARPEPAPPPKTIPVAPAEPSAEDLAEALVGKELADELARVREVRDWEVLGLVEDADPLVLRKAFLTLTKRYHPDAWAKYRDPAIQAAVAELFVLVREAYERCRSRARARPVPAAPRAQAPAPTSPAPRPVPSPAAPVESKAAPRAPSPLPSTLPPVHRAPPAPPVAEAATTARPARPLLAEDLLDGLDIGPAERPATLHNLTDMVAAIEGQEALQAGRYTEAKVKLTLALKTAPRDTELRAAFHLACGFEAKTSGRADEARQQFEKVLQYDKFCEEAIRELRGGKDEKSSFLSRILRGKDDK